MNTVSLGYGWGRRWLSAIITMCVVSGFVPLIGTLIAKSSYAPFQQIGHFGAMCFIFLHTLLAPVNSVLLIMLFAGLAFAAWDRFSAWREMKRTLSLLDGRSPSGKEAIGMAAAMADLPEGSVLVVDNLPNPAFTAGLWKRNVYINSSLADHLSFPELAAVMRHEAVHFKRRDPLRLSIIRFFSCMLFWLPALRRLSEDMIDEAEFFADSTAAGDEPITLASAILSLATWPDIPQGMARSATGFARQSTVERRVRALLGEKVTFRSNLTKRSIWSALVAISLMWTSGIAVSHPMPGGGLPADATLHNQFKCIQSWILGSDTECPHLVTLSGTDSSIWD